MGGALLLWSALVIATPAAQDRPGFDLSARLEGQARQDCKATTTDPDELLVCGRRESPYRIGREIMATLPPDPLQQSKTDRGQLALAPSSCQPTGPYACGLSGAAMVPVIPMILKAIELIGGKPVREVVRTAPEAYDKYKEAGGE